MPQLPFPLNIAIIDTDERSINRLSEVLHSIDGVRSVLCLRDVRTADSELLANGINALFIDPKPFDTADSIRIVSAFQARFGEVCIYSDHTSEFTDSNSDFSKSGGRVYALGKSLESTNFKNSAIQVVQWIASDVVARVARTQLETEVGELIETAHELKSLTPEIETRFREIASQAREAIDIQEEQRRRSQVSLVPGIEAEELRQVLNRTLQQAQRALETNSRVNIGVLVFGAVVVAASFVAAVVTQRWESTVFGGFGTAGIVAALISNPLRSIGTAARRLVQVQIAYFAFLGQMRMLGEPGVTGPSERSEKLGAEMRLTLEALEKYFGQ